jgi:RNA polymerase Rpb1, domain 5
MPMTKVKLVDLNEVILDDQKYTGMKNQIIDYLKTDFTRRKESITVEVEGQESKMSLANLLTNLMVLRPFNALKSPVTTDFIFDANNMNSSTLDGYFNRVIEYFSEEDFNILNKAISESIEEMSDMSGSFNVRIGNTISVRSLIELAERNPEFLDLLNTVIPNGMQFDEIEAYLKSRLDKLMNILSTDEKNVLYNYINSKTGINNKQLGQSIMNVGLKPDLFGNVIPEPINTNYLRGLRSPVDFYINATGARKALITNFKKVKESGYLTRKLSLLMIDTTLDYETDDCGTQHYVTVHVSDKDTLGRISGKWYLAGDELLLIEESNEDLIGQTIQMRSPITCASSTNKICRTCYGDNLAKINKDKHIGILAVLLLTNRLTQMLLSAKHLLQTKSSKIDWQPEFMEYFSVDRNMIMLNTIDNSAIIIDPDDITEDEENDYLTINSFKIRKQKGKLININTDIKLILSDEVVEMTTENRQDDGTIAIPLKALNPDSVVFNIIMENNELSASLQAILELIETNSHLGLEGVDPIYNKFIELLNESGIGIKSVHIELILRALIRDIEDPTQPPKFHLDHFPQYRILRVTDAVLKSPSVSVSLAFEQIKKQIESPDTYMKNGYSFVDELL